MINNDMLERMSKIARKEIAYQNQTSSTNADTMNQTFKVTTNLRHGASDIRQIEMNESGFPSQTVREWTIGKSYSRANIANMTMNNTSFNSPDKMGQGLSAGLQQLSSILPKDSNDHHLLDRTLTKELFIKTTTHNMLLNRTQQNQDKVGGGMQSKFIDAITERTGTFQGTVSN